MKPTEVLSQATKGQQHQAAIHEHHRKRQNTPLGCDPVLVGTGYIKRDFTPAGLPYRGQIGRGHGAFSRLRQRPYLLGDAYSAADLLVHSPYAWFRDAIPDDPAIAGWVARCMERPSVGRTMAADAALMGQVVAA